MSNETTIRREFWNGPPERLRELFTLTKPSGARASCALHSHMLGFEIRSTSMTASCAPKSSAIRVRFKRSPTNGAPQ
jgi:hypothetical protein